MGPDGRPTLALEPPSPVGASATAPLLRQPGNAPCGGRVRSQARSRGERVWVGVGGTEGGARAAYRRGDRSGIRG